MCQRWPHCPFGTGCRLTHLGAAPVGHRTAAPAAAVSAAPTAVPALTLTDFPHLQPALNEAAAATERAAAAAAAAAAATTAAAAAERAAAAARASTLSHLDFPPLGSAISTRIEVHFAAEAEAVSTGGGGGGGGGGDGGGGDDGGGSAAAASVLAWLCAPPARVNWPTTLRVPTAAQELCLVKFLDRDPGWADVEPDDYFELPQEQRQAFEAEAARLCISSSAAINLRRALMIDRNRLLGNTELAHAAGARAENAVGSTLARLGIAAESEAEQRAAGSTCTPDYMLRRAAVINGQEVRWIEVKLFFGAGIMRKSWAPSLQAIKQAKRYMEAYGPGAVVFAKGHSEALARRMPFGVLLLDSSALNDVALL